MSEIDAKLNFVARAIVALSKRMGPERASWRRVKEAVLRVASILRLEAGENVPPIKLEKIKESRHILQEAIFDGSGKGLDAILIPIPGGFLLRLKRNQSEVRCRFSTAHEIGHTFFYDLNAHTPTRLIPHNVSYLLSEKEEDICNAFARELLMPKELVQEDLLSYTEKNLQTIVDLGKKYAVSREVAARRLLLDLSEFQSSILLFKNLDVPSSNAWWYYGKALRRYLRKQEEAIFRQIVENVQQDRGPQNLQRIIDSNELVSIEHYQPMPGWRLMILVTFKR